MVLDVSKGLEPAGTAIFFQKANHARIGLHFVIVKEGQVDR